MDDLLKIAAGWLSRFYPAERIDRVLDSLSRHRRVVAVSLQAVLIVAANFIAFHIRFEGSIPQPQLHNFLIMLPLLLAVRMGGLYVFGLFHGLWRYVSIRDLVNIIASVSLGTVLFAVTVKYILAVTTYPWSVIIMDWFLAIVLLGGVRLLKRLHNEIHPHMLDAKRVLIIGAGDAGYMVLRELLNGRKYNYRVVGLIDDDAQKRGMKILNTTILGTTAELEEIVARKNPDEVVLAIPSAPIDFLRGIVSRCKKLGKPIKVLPGIKDLLFAKDLSILIRNIEAEDLLFREPVPNDSAALRLFFQGKKVMVTGAGGSIGSEISKQIAGYGPARLVLFERHEGSLYEIDRTLRETHPDLRVDAVMGDITDYNRVSEVMAGTMPDILFHAAANKHVPMMELNPSEAIKTNILGTRTVSAAAGLAGVDRFVLISTDKAVDPSNIMGGSKRVAELVTIASNALYETSFMAVRFGNVLESSGSVIPLFKKQIKAGGPITVTHPEVTRYFMTLSEAVLLLLHAASMGKGGEIFVLDMGEPVRIYDVARSLVNLYGFTPGKDIDIVFTGLRPGEKLEEKLFNSHERVLKTMHPKVNMAVNGDGDVEDPQEVFRVVDTIERVMREGRLSDAVKALESLVPTYSYRPLTLGPDENVGETFKVERSAARAKEINV